MKTEKKLNELLFQIEEIRDFGEYTMNNLQLIAEKAVKIINKKNPNSESIIELNKAIEDSNDCHKKRIHRDGDNIMEVLRQTKFAIESFLHKEYGNDF
jgi:predicted ribosome quality control (RQC) complex YloA/Tae2 family protein